MGIQSSIYLIPWGQKTTWRAKLCPTPHIWLPKFICYSPDPSTSACVFGNTVFTEVNKFKWDHAGTWGRDRASHKSRTVAGDLPVWGLRRNQPADTWLADSWSPELGDNKFKSFLLIIKKINVNPQSVVLGRASLSNSHSHQAIQMFPFPVLSIPRKSR